MEALSIQPRDALSDRFRDITSHETEVISLDDRLIQAFSQSAVGFGMEKDSILAQLDNPDAVTSPGGLFALQQQTSNYNLEVSLVSTLSRKTVAAVEGLLRS